MQIRGLQFHGHDQGGKRVLSLKADRFTIEKKKIGFFRVGLLNMVRIENGVIDLYGRIRESSLHDPAPHPDQDSAKQQAPMKAGDNITFKDLFSKDALPSFSVKNISSIEIRPVCINLHMEKSRVSQIKASEATIRLRERDVFFRGEVQVVSGPRSLTTDHLIFLPEQGIISTDQNYILKTPVESLNGNGLTTDIFVGQNKVHFKGSS